MTIENLEKSDLSAIETQKPKPTSIARPDVVIQNEQFMSNDMLEMLRPQQKLNIDKLPIGYSASDLYPQFKQDQKFPEYVNKVIEAYTSGMRYKEFRSTIKRQQKREEKAKMNEIKITHNKTISFE